MSLNPLPINSPVFFLSYVIFFADVVAPYWKLVTKEWVDQVHARGQEMYVWTVNNPEVAKRLASWGVDTLISDNPELIANSL